MMRMKRLLVLRTGGLLLVGLLAAACGTAAADGMPSVPPIAAPAGFGPQFYGVNFDLETNSLFANDPNVDHHVASLHPGTIRWPGGTEADFYDWHTGTVPHNTFKFTLQNLDDAWQATGPTPATRATPMFDLNVLANPTDTSDQIQMLRNAQGMGLPVHYVELGNELYFSGPNNAFSNGFPTGTDYGKTVAAYVKQLHQQFPGVQVGADAALHPAPNTPREDTWNAEMLAAAAAGGGSPDAVILHNYPGPSFANLTMADLPTLFGGPYKAVADIAAITKSLGDRPIWLTEYNLDPWVNGHHGGPQPPNAVQTSYAHELFLAELGLMLPRADHVTLADNWSTFGKTPFLGAWADPANPSLTPPGQAVRWLGAAGQGATSSVPITVPGVPTLPDGQPAVTGQAFRGAGRATTAVLVNLTTGVQAVPVSADVPAGAPYEQVTGDPTAQQAVAGLPQHGKVSATALLLPPYSVTLVDTTAD